MRLLALLLLALLCRCSTAVNTPFVTESTCATKCLVISDESTRTIQARISTWTQSTTNDPSITFVAHGADLPTLGLSDLVDIASVLVYSSAQPIANAISVGDTLATWLSSSAGGGLVLAGTFTWSQSWGNTLPPLSPFNLGTGTTPVDTSSDFAAWPTTHPVQRNVASAQPSGYHGRQRRAAQRHRHHHPAGIVDGQPACHRHHHALWPQRLAHRGHQRLARSGQQRRLHNVDERRGLDVPLRHQYDRFQ